MWWLASSLEALLWDMVMPSNSDESYDEMEMLRIAETQRLASLPKATSTALFPSWQANSTW